MKKLQRYLRRVFGQGRKRHFFVSPTVRQFKKLLQRPIDLYTTHPLLMNTITYGSLCVGAELSQQLIRNSITKVNEMHLKTSKKDNKSTVMKLDYSAIPRVAFWGTCVIPPIFHVWYKWLDNKIPTKCPQTGVISGLQVIKKCILDQFFFTPPLLALFFGTMAAWNYIQSKNFTYKMSEMNETWKHIKSEKEETWNLMKSEVITKVPLVFVADCAFWIPVMALNFGFVPISLRQVVVSIASFVWLNVLCFAKTYQIQSEDEANISTD